MTHARFAVKTLVRSFALAAVSLLPAAAIADESALDGSALDGSALDGSALDGRALPSIFGEYVELRSDLTRAILTTDEATDEHEHEHEHDESGVGESKDDAKDAKSAKDADEAAVDEPRLLLRGQRRGRGFTHRNVMAWNISHGSWNGQEIAGLSFALVFETEGPIRSPLEGKRRAVLFVDKKADKDQLLAVKTLISELVPKYTRDIVKVRASKMRFHSKDHDVKLTVDKQLSLHVETHEHDESSACQSVCGKDPQPAKPLSKYTRIERALSKKDLYLGTDLPVRWSAKESGHTLHGRWAL